MPIKNVVVAAAWVVTGLVSPLFADPMPAVADSYERAFNIKFSGYSGSTTLTNFPALIRLSAARNDFKYSKCKDKSGGDLRFFDANGNLLASEIDTWNTNGESLVWVSVPELNKRTVITACYGNTNAPAVTPTDVWTNGYVGVWHMNAAGGTFTQKDSTAAGRNIAPNSSYRAGILCGVEGAVGAAAELGRDSVTNGGFQVYAGKGVFDGFSAITLEIWTFQTSYSTANAYLFQKYDGGSSTRGFNFFQRSGGKIAGYIDKINNETKGYSDIWQNSGDGAQLNEWTHQVFRWNGVSGRHTGFLNGISVNNNVSDSRKGVSLQVSANLCVGNTYADNYGNQVFPGKIDEVRISSVARSDDWVKATHDTIANEDFAVSVIPNDWTLYPHKFNISFPGVEEGATLVDFPVLVKISEDGISGFRYADCAKNGGEDLRFTDGNGTTPLPCEVEVWDTNGVSLVWVKVPALTKGARITCYYGCSFAPTVVATDVWDANYLAVWHMNAAGDSLSQRDATANNRTISLDAAYADNIVRGVDGIVGGAADFGHRADGKGNYGCSNGDGTFDGLMTATFEFWTRQEAVPTNKNSYIIYCGQANPTVTAYSLAQANNGNTGITYYSDVGGTATYVWGGSASTPWNQWNHHAFRYDGVGGKTSYFQNNVLKWDSANSDVDGHSILAVKNQFCIGSFTTVYTANANYVGLLDEVRISKVARSDAWVKATHDTIAENSTFTRYGKVGANISGILIFVR